jgi:hypothetical protein
MESDINSALISHLSFIFSSSTHIITMSDKDANSPPTALEAYLARLQLSTNPPVLLAPSPSTCMPDTIAATAAPSVANTKPQAGDVFKSSSTCIPDWGEHAQKVVPPDVHDDNANNHGNNNDDSDEDDYDVHIEDSWDLRLKQDIKDYKERMEKERNMSDQVHLQDLSRVYTAACTHADFAFGGLYTEREETPVLTLSKAGSEVKGEGALGEYEVSRAWGRKGWLLAKA